jgi:hypothetical protein
LVYDAGWGPAFVDFGWRDFRGDVGGCNAVGKGEAGAASRADFSDVNGDRFILYEGRQSGDWRSQALRRRRRADGVV